MNTSDPRDPSDRDDSVVDQFFAAHRGRVADHHADDETWTAITTRAREARGRSRGAWFLAGAVAASAAAVAVIVGQGLGGPEASPAGTGGDAPVVAATDAPSGSDAPTEVETDPVLTTDPPPLASDGPGTDTSTAAQEGDAPTSAGFTLPPADLSAGVRLVGEPTGEESPLRTVVYETDCPAGEMEWSCPGLAVSEDAGESWTARVDMYAAGFYAAVSSGDRTWMWGPGGDGRPGVPQVQDGLVRSDDGGRTWTEVATRGDGVLWAEAFGSSLVVVTAGCETGSAATCAEVVVAGVEADDATSGRRTITIEGLPPVTVGVPSVFPEGGLQATFDAVYVHMPSRGVSYRIADGEEVATRVDRPGCTVSSAPVSRDRLLSWCPDGTPVQLSGDGGKTWRDVQGPGGAVLAAASNDGRRLAVATQEALWVGDAGGPDEAGEPADAGWEQVLAWAPGRTLLEALGDSSMRFGGPYRYLPESEAALSQRWVTHDDWRTFTEEPRIEITTTG